jgi:hypothetical protein
MLASITPLGERGRQSHWGITVTAFLVGAVAAGAALGSLAGGVGALVLPRSLGAHARLAAFAASVLVAIALDTRREAAPGPRRQVNERWLDEYRGWVYGLGYGAQLGLGLVTVVSSAATYVALLAAFLTANPGAGALVVGCHGAVRGLTPLLTAHVRTPRQLVALHAGLERWRGAARGGAVVLLAAILALAVAGSAL